jgi:hypothetical protein
MKTSSICVEKARYLAGQPFKKLQMVSEWSYSLSQRQAKYWELTGALKPSILAPNSGQFECIFGGVFSVRRRCSAYFQTPEAQFPRWRHLLSSLLILSTLNASISGSPFTL